MTNQASPDAATRKEAADAAIPAEIPTTATLDRLLSKYVHVWLWSILFGSNTGVLYAYVAYRSDTTWGGLSVLPVALLLMGVVASLAALSQLFRYLKNFLLPQFFSSSEAAEFTSMRLPATRALAQAFSYFIISIVIRMLLVAVDILFAAFRSGRPF